MLIIYILQNVLLSSVGFTKDQFWQRSNQWPLGKIARHIAELSKWSTSHGVGPDAVAEMLSLQWLIGQVLCMAKQSTAVVINTLVIVYKGQRIFYTNSVPNFLSILD